MDLILFPSPLGVSYFQISVVNLKGGRNMNNFRPLSGYLISKCFERIPIAKSTFNFRPLSGYLISKYLLEEYNRKLVEFPSPLGVSYFQILSARARYFTGFSDSFAWQIIFLYIFLISKHTQSPPNAVFMRCAAKLSFFLINCCTHLF